MVAPLVGVAVAAAAKLAAKKLAQKVVKKKVINKIAMTPKQAALKKKAAVKVGPKSSVKVIKPGTKPLTKPDVPYSAKAPRSPDQLRRMGL